MSNNPPDNGANGAGAQADDVATEFAAYQAEQEALLAGMAVGVFYSFCS